MKTKRRHELQTNQLADTLAHGIEAVKPYTRVILGLMLAIVVLGCTYAYLSAQSTARQDHAWDDYIKAMEPDPMTMDINLKELTDLADNAGTTHAGEWARLALADRELREGIEQVFTDKAEGTQRLRQAVELYENALHDARDPMLKQGALFGLARANETLGELDTAVEDYAKLQSEFPYSAFASEAKRRQNDLQRSSTKAFYAWFANFEPEKRASKLPGTPGERPTDKSLEDEVKGAPDFPPSDFEKKFPVGGGGAGQKAAEPGTEPEAPAAENVKAPEGKNEAPGEKPAPPAEKTDAPPEKSAAPVEKREASDPDGAEKASAKGQK